MGIYKYMREFYRKKSKVMRDLYKARILDWKNENTTTRIDVPTRLDRARSLGYKAKEGYIIVRQRVNRGGRMNPSDIKGRRTKHYGRRKDLSMSYQWVAEERAQDKYRNLEVLNSYFVGKDGQHYWYEIILIDKNHPAIKADQNIKWINESQHTGRVYRGLTSAGRRSRGLLNKGKGAEKIRPSIGAHNGLAK